MPNKKAVLLAAVVLLVAAGGVGFALWKDAGGTDCFREDYLYSVVKGELRYDFDPTWRKETLYRRADDGIWRSIDRPTAAEVDPLRAVLLQHFGFQNLEAIPEEGKPEVDSLKGLGY